ncbi:MAG TPA: nuclear transport factor 2 family protein [Solimonas sp.]|nr:nuclear transport factor 2 family protein [Solimonas sp.]
MEAPALKAWHAVVQSRDPNALKALLADGAVFWSPVLHTPQRGKAMVMLYLGGAMQVIGNPSFRYLREIVGPQDACLEFESTIDGIVVNGVDLIRWNAQGQIVDFKVMLRPAKALAKVQERMAAMLKMVPAGFTSG